MGMSALTCGFVECKKFILSLSVHMTPFQLNQRLQASSHNGRLWGLVSTKQHPFPRMVILF